MASARRLDGVLVTGRLLELFGPAIRLGRAIGAGDDRTGAERVVMLSTPFWRSHFAGDAAVIGRTLTLSGDSYTVVGVLAQSFSFPGDRADVIAAFALLTRVLASYPRVAPLEWIRSLL